MSPDTKTTPLFVPGSLAERRSKNSQVVTSGGESEVGDSRDSASQAEDQGTGAWVVSGPQSSHLPIGHRLAVKVLLVQTRPLWRHREGQGSPGKEVGIPLSSLCLGGQGRVPGALTSHEVTSDGAQLCPYACGAPVVGAREAGGGGGTRVL